MTGLTRDDRLELTRLAEDWLLQSVHYRTAPQWNPVRSDVLRENANALLEKLNLITVAMRYTEVTDHSSHHYLIPVERLNDWTLWMDNDEDDPVSWDVPSWAVPVDGGRLTFTNPRIG